jgi:hypothetical protein
MCRLLYILELFIDYRTVLEMLLMWSMDHNGPLLKKSFKNLMKIDYYVL